MTTLYDVYGKREQFSIYGLQLLEDEDDHDLLDDTGGDSITYVIDPNPCKNPIECEEYNRKITVVSHEPQPIPELNGNEPHASHVWLSSEPSKQLNGAGFFPCGEEEIDYDETLQETPTEKEEGATTTEKEEGTTTTEKWEEIKTTETEEVGTTTKIKEKTTSNKKEEESTSTNTPQGKDITSSKESNLKIAQKTNGKTGSVSISGKIAKDKIQISKASEREKDMFMKIHKAFVLQMRKLEVPIYIQHFHPSRYYLKITVNIKKENYKDGREFLEQNCPKFMDYLRLVKQPFSPECLMDDVDASHASLHPSSRIKDTVKPGCKICLVSCSEQIMKEVFKEDILNLHQLQTLLKTHKIDQSINSVSIGCFAVLLNEEKRHILTCQHIFSKKHFKMSEDDCQLNQVIAVPKQGKLVYLGTQVAGMFGNKPQPDEVNIMENSDFNDDYFDQQIDETDEPFLDVAVIAVNNPSSNNNTNNFENDHGDLEVKQVSHSKEVQKIGAVTGKTQGTITMEKIQFNNDGRCMGDFFEVQPIADKPFTDLGDSGAIVTNKFGSAITPNPNLAYGICSHRQQVKEEYDDDDDDGDDESNLTYKSFCAHLNQCLSELKTNYQLNLKILWH